jgi:hypothetical protein
MYTIVFRHLEVRFFWYCMIAIYRVIKKQRASVSQYYWSVLFPCDFKFGATEFNLWLEFNIFSSSSSSSFIGFYNTLAGFSRRDLYLKNTQHSQQTNIHVPGGIRTRSLSRRAAADPRLRPLLKLMRNVLPHDRYSASHGDKIICCDIWGSYNGVNNPLLQTIPYLLLLTFVY